MEMCDFYKEFVERTKKIIEQGGTNEIEYDVTLLINCLLGLVCLPTEYTKMGEDSEFQAECVSQLKKLGVIEMSSGKDKTTFNALRNAVSHMHIMPENSGGIISGISFFDKNPKKDNVHTKFTFTVEALKEYALFVADKHLERF